MTELVADAGAPERPFLRRVYARLAEPLAITPGKLSEIAEVLAARPASSKTNAAPPAWYAAGPVAVVPIGGTLVKATGGVAAESGLMSYAQIEAGFRGALTDPNTDTVLLHVDSFGGEVNGLFALADQIHGARGGKPIIALVDEAACSAAYLLAAAADRIVLGSAIAQIGSIGVIVQHVDRSRADAMAGLSFTTLAVGARKADGNPHAPLSEDARASMMARLGAVYIEFATRVASFRGLPLQTVTATEAAVYFGAEALQLRLADAIQAPGELLLSLQAPSNKPRSSDMKMLSLPTAPVAAYPAGDAPGDVSPERLAMIRSMHAAHNLTGAEILHLMNAPMDQLTAGVTPGRMVEATGIVAARGGNPIEAFDIAADPVQLMRGRAQRGEQYLAQLRADEANTPHPPAVPLSDGYASSYDDPAFKREAMATAIAARLNPRLTPSEPGREYMSRSLVEMAAELAEARGVRVRGLSRSQVVEAAMQRVGAYHGTGDFPALLRSAGERALMFSYEAAPAAIKLVAKRRRARDFRPLSSLRLSEAPKLLEVGEDGEVQHGTMGEAKETYSVRTFARIFGLTRQAIINDDLGAFADWTQRMGVASAELEADLLVGLLNENGGMGPTLDDAKSLFHADHGNLAAAGAALSVATLGAARQAMRDQTGLDGTTPINATPRYLLVGSALETVAEQVLAQIYAATVNDANPFAGKLALLVEPRIKGNRWRLFADPQVCPVLEQAYLQDAEGPQVTSREGFDTMGMEFRVSIDVGAGAVDHRGAYLNAGA
ncbi:S49 family peptidase [Azospirillum brasilense]|uniref:Peptidase S49 domain-containing protein n=1 Tax=Azospirillum brasilense TaxID=192 RepID=A0A235H2P2_AZOBR|nr:S49 family peptidase [Azospirillum brasilense]OYD80116.1 hypothetical protein CHT98_32910 [Azospirillum brasilense]